MTDDIEIYDDEWEDDYEDGQRLLNLRKIVAFELDNELYGVDIAMVAEIMRLVPIRIIPHVPKFILGLINLRGNILPVIDLRICFKLHQKDWSPESRIIVMKDNTMLVGVAVDHLWEMFRLSPEVFQPPPPGVAKIDAEYFKEVAPIDNRMLIVLDIKKILSDTRRK
ncbi:MAG: chemotaxis protein CheW [Deltaproteobacteria bacterium]|nr:chemotaxis protein CheW [Deltaproteobacteria bacterium]